MTTRTWSLWFELAEIAESLRAAELLAASAQNETGDSHAVSEITRSVQAVVALARLRLRDVTRVISDDGDLDPWLLHGPHNAVEPKPGERICRGGDVIFAPREATVPALPAAKPRRRRNR